jgi:hypothetical protein
MSYRDGMYFGLIACRELVPDLDDMAGHIVSELALLTAEVDRRTAANGSPTQRRAQKSAPGRSADHKIHSVR